MATPKRGPGDGWRTGRPPGHGPAMLVYILMLLGFAAPFAAVAGVVVAHLKRGEADAVARTHLDFAIRTFWLGLALTVAATMLLLVAIGWALFALWAAWTLARLISGMLRLDEGRAVREPLGAGFFA